MLTDRQVETIARGVVTDEYPPGCEILSRIPYSDPPGTFFIANVPGDVRDQYLCMGGFFVERQAGEVWRLGCQQTCSEGVEFWLKFFGEGWKIAPYRVTLRRVETATKVAELFVRYELSYTVLELAHGAVWQDEVPYSKRTVVRRLRDLPAVFHIQGQALRAMLPELQALATFDYSVVEESAEYSWRPEDYSEDSLGPQW